ncbi:MAG: FeoB-associated Cys-rich membrane protein [Bacteroidetes bacterium]|nr:FeoB-associated Cys-rich membrane protein [Bacteroidota bacterium]
MNIQEIILALVFVLSVFFIGRRIYKSISAKSCAKGCGGCSTIDFSKIDTSKFEAK